MGYFDTREAYDKRHTTQPNLQVVLKTTALLILAALATSKSFAQISVQQNANTQTLAQLLAGTGVTISNYTKTCDNNGTGTFTSNTNLGINQGIVLASGRVQNIPQAANNFASTQFSNSNDAQLSGLTTGTIYDKCILEFDITPQGNTLQFEYVFASEEYPEFVCSPFNDVFGFFISGPNPQGGNYTNKNIAVIPNSTTPVFINSVNPGISGTYNSTTWNSGNCQSLNNTTYYINNLTPLNTTIVYDGMTVVLTARADVTPCQTYHLKLAIADVGDRIYDSGVFLKAYSFTSTAVTLAASAQLDYAGFTSAYEGCVGGSFTVNLSAPQSVADTVNLQISGTATNGSDYATIPSSVIIPAGQTSVTIPLTAIQDNLAESAETVTIAVINPCTGLPISSATITIEDSIPVSLTVSDSTLCQGQSANLQVTGGLTYNWSPASTLSSSTGANTIATPTSNTTYSVTTTFGSCNLVLTQPVYVSQLSLSVSAAPSAIMCNGGNASINSTVTGTASPFTYLWNNGTTGNSISVNGAGSYTLTVTDAYACSATATTAVQVSNISAGIVLNPVACYGGTTGSASVTPTGGIAPYNYIWNNGKTTANNNSLAAGNYSVTITDASGCSVTAGGAVTQPTAFLSVSPTVNNVACFGNNTGSINLNVSGGTTPYTFNWSNGTSQQNASNLTAGNYQVTVTDARACSATAGAIITQPSAAVSAYATTIAVDCFGASTGSVNLSVSGGTLPYNFNWSNGSTVTNQTNLTAGSYTVTVSDANGCSTTSTANITQSSAALTATVAPQNINCFGGNTGSIALNVTGGTTPYSFSWNNGSSTQNLSNIIAGTYAVTVVDAKGCLTNTTATVTQPASALSAATTTTAVACFGNNTGNINLNVSGGTTPYTFNWSNGTSQQNASNLNAGNYQVTVTDAKACSATAGAIVTQPAAAVSAYTTPIAVNCFGASTGSINLSVSGGTLPYNFNWSNGSTVTNQTNLTAGSYTVTVSDANGCSATSTANITQPSAALTATATPQNINCFGGNTGSITLNVTGGTTPNSFSWNNGSSTQNLSNIVAGTYAVTVVDAKGCLTNTTAVVTQPANALSATTTTVAVACFGNNTGSIDLNVSGGTTPYTFNWSNGTSQQHAANLLAGNYSVTVVDAQACSVTVSAVVTQPTAALTAAANALHVNCFGGNTGSISLGVSGGTTPYSFSWNNGSTLQNVSNLSAGNYAVTITDLNGCSAVVTSNINEPVAALNIIAQPQAVKCFGANTGNIILNTTGGTTPYNFAWNTGSNQQNLSNLLAGNYEVTVTDAKGCIAQATTVITQPAAALAAQATAQAVACFGNSTGSINVVTTGGVTPYSYIWNNGSTQPALTNVLAGNYAATVTDANGCTANCNALVTQPATALTANGTTQPVSCYGTNAGNINLSVAGGTLPYSFSWSNNSILQNLTGLIAGSYSVTVTDVNGCSTSTSLNITQPAAALNVTATAQAATCFGANNGSITTTIAGGTTPYSYAWSNTTTQPNATGLTAGSYQITVTDANGCSASATSVITQPAAALSAGASAQAVSCYGGNNGAISLSVNGGTAPYTYNWSNGSNVQNLINVNSGSYQVTVTDAQNCSTTSSIIVAQPAAELHAVVNATNALCHGDSTGSVTTTTSGGTTPYQFTWNDGGTQSYKNNLPAGSYNVTVTDANNCSTASTAIVAQPAPLVSSSITIDATCAGSTNGSANLAITGGVPPYLIYNTNGVTISTEMVGLSAGNYSLLIVDSNNCQNTLNVHVTEPSAIALAATVAAATCYGSSNGAVNMIVTGGTGSYTYEWSNNATTPSISNLNAGVYNVSVYDANGCMATLSKTVTQPNAALAATITADSVSCTGGNNAGLQLTATGGTIPYSFNWNNNSTTQNQSNLTAGVYTVTVTDAQNCSTTAAANITQPAAALSTAVTKNNVTCHGGNNGNATLSVTGGTLPYSYQWSNNTNGSFAGNLTAGNYTVSVTDKNGCSTTANAQITQPAPISINKTQSNVLCYGDSSGAVNLSVSGGIPGYTYQWSNGSTAPSLSNLPAGTYNLMVTDVEHCPAGIAVTITQPDFAVAANINPQAVKCKGQSNGTINLIATGGTPPYTYEWNTGSSQQNAQQLTAGTYKVTVTDAHGCTDVAAAAIDEPSAVQLAETHSNASCVNASNGTVNLHANGGIAPYHYQWSNGATTQNAQQLSPGNYSVTVNDANLCTATVSFNIAQPQPLVVNATATPVQCYGGSTGIIQTTVSGGTPGYNYQWSNGAVTSAALQLTAGTYTVTVTDAKNCSATASKSVGQATAIQPVFNSFMPLCNGSATGTITTTVTGGQAPYTYQWNNNSTQANVTGLPAGAYTVTVTDSKQCTVTATVNLTEPAPLTATETHTNPLCYATGNGTIQVAVNGGTAPYQYYWNNGTNNSSVSNLSNGTYSVVIVDENGCGIAINSIILNQPDSLAVSLQSSNVLCHNTASGQVASTIKGGTQPYNYQWNNNATTANLNNALAGSYNITVTDANGCSQIGTALVNNVPALIISAVTTPAICSNASGNINVTATQGTAPYTFAWNNGATTEDIHTTPGTYTLSVTDANGCVVDSTFTINNLNQFTVEASGGGTVNLGESVNLNAQSNGTTLTSYSWTPAQTVGCPTCANTTAVPVRYTVYTVVATDTNGCVAQDTVSADVIEDYTSFTPNAFTPNGDGNNDYFQFYGNTDGLKELEIMIFNRWGEKVYEATEPHFKWDGMYKGEPAPEGVYVYIMKLVFINGHVDKIHKGSLTVIR